MSDASDRQQLIADLRATVRAAVRRANPGSIEPDTWRLLVEQVGIAGMLVPETHGGLGLGAPELVAVAEEVGAAAVGVPFLSHTVAAAMLLGPADTTADANGNGARARLLDEVAAGGHRVAVVRSPGISATQADTNRVRLTGTASVVVDAPGAEVLLVGATAADQSVVCAVATSAPGLGVTERSALDLSRSIGSVSLDQTPAEVLTTGADARRALQQSLHWSRLAIAADQVGIARRILDLTVEYAGMRTQFGAAIGSFQAVKHRCTEVLLEVELAAALVDQAAAALDAREDPLDLLSTAALQASTAALAATEAAIALHGGIGFTWEHVAHHYFRRARSNASLLGPPQELRDAVAASVGL